MDGDHASCVESVSRSVLVCMWWNRCGGDGDGSVFLCDTELGTGRTGRQRGETLTEREGETRQRWIDARCAHAVCGIVALALSLYHSLALVLVQRSSLWGCDAISSACQSSLPHLRYGRAKSPNQLVGNLSRTSCCGRWRAKENDNQGTRHSPRNPDRLVNRGNSGNRLVPRVSGKVCDATESFAQGSRFHSRRGPVYAGPTDRGYQPRPLLRFYLCVE